MKRVLRILIGMLVVAGIYGYALALKTMWPIGLNHIETLYHFVLGILLYFLLWMLYLRKKAPFWSVLEHELTHAIFAALFLKRIRSLRAHSRGGGSVTVEGGNPLIALAPYFFPLPAMTMVLLKFLVFSTYYPYIHFGLGFFTMFHLIPLSQEFHWRQPDIQYVGVLFSTLLVVFFNIFFLGIILATLFYPDYSVGTFVKAGYWHSWHLLSTLYHHFLR